MRAGMISVLIAAVLALCGCGSYNQVNQGWQGATSPAESGQHGAKANQGPPVVPEEKGKPEQKEK